jgi:SAM-dependent methyltransferase
VIDWHQRFRQQAGWTRDLRTYLFTRAGASTARLVLEVGCGTGAVLLDLITPAAVHGIDIDSARLQVARQHLPGATFTCADALTLPFSSARFDITCCHFLLLWVSDPLLAIQEMRRVTRPGGAVLALAEPDYSARVDEPPSLAPLGRLQADSLRRQGADPSIGRRLADLFLRAGLTLLESGTMQAAVSHPDPASVEMEWSVLASDLAGMLPPEELERFHVLDQAAWCSGKRRLHVPT